MKESSARQPGGTEGVCGASGSPQRSEATIGGSEERAGKSAQEIHYPTYALSQVVVA